jgi:hypothetical protein
MKKKRTDASCLAQEIGFCPVPGLLRLLKAWLVQKLCKAAAPAREECNKY